MPERKTGSAREREDWLISMEVRQKQKKEKGRWRGKSTEGKIEYIQLKWNKLQRECTLWRNIVMLFGVQIWFPSELSSSRADANIQRECAFAYWHFIIHSHGQPWYVLVFTPLELMALLLQSFKINPSGQRNTNTHSHTRTHFLWTPEGEVTKGN